MSAIHEILNITTNGKGTYEITEAVAGVVRKSGIETGTVTVFVQHTSASLVIYENADPTAREDLHRYFEELFPEDWEGATHTMEGPDDTTSHLRMAVTRTSEVIPIINGHLALGTWQGIFLFEHRHRPHRRQIAVVVMG